MDEEGNKAAHPTEDEEERGEKSAKSEMNEWMNEWVNWVESSGKKEKKKKVWESETGATQYSGTLLSLFRDTYVCVSEWVCEDIDLLKNSGMISLSLPCWNQCWFGQVDDEAVEVDESYFPAEPWDTPHPLASAYGGRTIVALWYKLVYW